MLIWGGLGLQRRPRSGSTQPALKGWGALWLEQWLDSEIGEISEMLFFSRTDIWRECCEKTGICRDECRPGSPRASCDH